MMPEQNLCQFIAKTPFKEMMLRMLNLIYIFIYLSVWCYMDTGPLQKTMFYVHCLLFYVHIFDSNA